MTRTVAVVVPVFNEAPVLTRMIDGFDRAPLADPGTGEGGVIGGQPVRRVIYLVDDGSTDGTREVLDGLAGRPDVVVHARPSNGGKGAAVRDGIALALADGPGDSADIVLIHDADLEYDPADHPAVLAPILAGEADAVLGTRFHPGNRVRGVVGVGGLAHRWANGLLTLLSNAATGLRLRDMECCTKAFARDVALRLEITEPRFGLEPELVATLGRLVRDGRRSGRPLRVVEVPVRYRPRGWREGKKIGWRDFVRAVYVILRSTRH